MPLGDSVLADSYDYTIGADHVNGETVVINVTRMDFGNPENVDQPVQDLVDMLSADPRWTVVTANKILKGQAAIIPTPPE
jgi:hypothetical protein